MTKEYFYFNPTEANSLNPAAGAVVEPVNSLNPTLTTSSLPTGGVTTSVIALTDHDINDLVSNYNNKTKEVIEKHAILVNLRKLKDDYQHNLDNTIDKNMTKKRMIEMSLNRTRRINYLIDSSKYLLIIVGVLLLFPILYRFNILSKTVSLVIWGIGVVAIILLSLYFVYLENPKRNVHNFNSLDFENPGNKGNSQVAIDGGMFDGLNDISPDMFNRYVSDPKNDKCHS